MRNVFIKIIIFLILIVSTIICQEEKINIIIPDGHYRLIHAPGASIKGMVSSSVEGNIQILQKNSVSKIIKISNEEEKINFPKEFVNLFPKDFYLTNIEAISKLKKDQDSTNVFSFPIIKAMNLEKFWEVTEFRKILAQVYDIEAIEITINLQGWNIDEIGIDKNDDSKLSLFSKRVKFEPGENPLYINFIDTSRIIKAQDSIFYYYPYEEDDVSSRFAYTESKFHLTENENGCKVCHGEINDNSCSACHSAILEQNIVHTPVEDGECYSCHDTESLPRNQLVADITGDTEHCIGCHGDIEEKIYDADVIHPPATESCTMCHDAHGSSLETLTRIPVFEICQSCHEDSANDPHPTPNHPLGGVSDPSRPGKTLSCASCHDPHGSEHESLLQESGYTLCQKCHKK